MASPFIVKQFRGSCETNTRKRIVSIYLKPENKRRIQE